MLLDFLEDNGVVANAEERDKLLRILQEEGFNIVGGPATTQSLSGRQN